MLYGCSKGVELPLFLLLVLMPVSVPLSYEFVVYLLINNKHFILGSVKVAKWPLLQLHEAAPSINYYDMLCSLCKRSVLICVIFFQFVISVSKFSRSLYLDNHLSESTHTLTIVIL